MDRKTVKGIYGSSVRQINRKTDGQKHLRIGANCTGFVGTLWYTSTAINQKDRWTVR
jgi:hypothetical protein